MATVVVKLEPLDDPTDVPLNIADYNVVDIKTEELDWLQSPDAESQGNPPREVTHNANKRPRLLINEESQLRTNNNSSLTTNAGNSCRHIPIAIDRSRRSRSSITQDLPRESGNRSSTHEEHRREENGDQSYEQRNRSDTYITSRPEPISANTLSESDSLKIFFDAMYHDTKALPLHLQIRTKRILFQAVADGQDIAGISRPFPSPPTGRVSSSGQMTDFNIAH